MSDDQRNSSKHAEQRILGTSRQEEPKLVPFLKTRLEIGSPSNIAGTCSRAHMFQYSPNLPTVFPPLLKWFCNYIALNLTGKLSPGSEVNGGEKGRIISLQISYSKPNTPAVFLNYIHQELLSLYSRKN